MNDFVINHFSHNIRHEKGEGVDKTQIQTITRDKTEITKVGGWREY